MFMGLNMHELGLNKARTVYEVTMTVDIKSMKYEQKFPNFMPVARENLLCSEHEHGMNMPQNYEILCLGIS